jgi:hypothetical protein
MVRIRLQYPDHPECSGIIGATRPAPVKLDLYAIT